MNLHAMTNLDDLAAFLTLGPSIVVATRDARMVTEISRCGGARIGSDGLLRLALPVPDATRALANIEANGCIALTAALPTTFRTFQIKGYDARLIEWPEMSGIVFSHERAFSAEAEAAGLAPILIGRLWSKRFRCVAFTPRDVFDQTPGLAA